MTASVLLVDDTPGEVANFAAAFDALTQVRTISQLDDALAAGHDWGLAFVDFNIGSVTHTGLSALLRLRSERPQTRLVAYSQLAESGRTLYACAARHWFNADALLDKVHNDSANLRFYAEQLTAGVDPTPVRWQQRLEHAGLIDDIVAEPYWVQIWRALYEAAGEMQAAARLLGRDPTHLRGFKDRAMPAVVEYNFEIHDIARPRNQRNKKGVLATFAARHWQFLGAPDLATAMSPISRTTPPPARASQRDPR
jgi:ActR/RegA family two-component response regulator